MYWTLSELTREPSEPAAAMEGRRFVLHRHTDAAGPHFDLRLEAGHCLVGWRIAGEELSAGCWATEKTPHPKTWLDQDRDARRELSGIYRWDALEPSTRILALEGEHETLHLRFERRREISTETVRALAEWAEQHRMNMAQLAGLAEDGLAARRNAMARFCGLSRELDGAGFDEKGWRALLEGMGLREIGERLTAVEVRYDRMHPPEAVSRSEPLEPLEEHSAERTQRALRLLDD